MKNMFGEMFSNKEKPVLDKTETKRLDISICLNMRFQHVSKTMFETVFARSWFHFGFPYSLNVTFVWNVLNK